MEELVLYFSLKYAGDFKKIYNALLQKERVNESLKHELFKKINCCYTTIFSDDYPEMLKEINCPPFVLYYYGDLSLVKTKTIGVIGMRDVSEYGIKITNEYVEELVKNEYTIVSGMARGVDGIAHQKAMNLGGKTIAVLGTGIEYCYPSSHKLMYEKLKKDHLVLSEYPLWTSPTKQQFPFRNRIVAGLSQSILVTEARVKSGTMITVGYALEQGKDIYAIPCNIHENDGCNMLIQQGAFIANDVMNIIEEKNIG